MRVAEKEDVAHGATSTQVGDAREKIATFVFGVAALATMLGLALWVPNPTESQWVIFRVVLAAAAGGAVVFLPGAVKVNIKPSLRASGALGIFALVYAVNPPKTSPAPAEPATQPLPVHAGLVQSAPNKSDLELKLSFSKNDRDKLKVWDANVSAIVNGELVVSDLPRNDPKVESKLVQRGEGGIIVTLPKLSPGDKISVRVEQPDGVWRSDELRMPQANLTMTSASRSASSGGQR